MAKLNSIIAAQQALARGVPQQLVNSADSIALLAFANGTHPWFKQQQAAAAQAAVAPAAQAPAAAAPAADPVKPYLTPEQQMAADDSLFNIDDGVYNLNKSYGDLEANTKYETEGVNKREQENNAAAVENMIARGLFRSSIKDSELADVAASAKARRDYLQTGLETARIDRDVRVKKLQDRKTELFGTDGTAALGTGGTYDQIAVQNAQAIEPTLAPTTPGATAPLNTGNAADPGQKKIVASKAKQQAANAFATSTARAQASAAKSESQSQNKKRKIAKPRKPGRR